MKKLFLSAVMLFSMCIGMNAQTKIVFNEGPLGLDFKFKRSFVQGTTLFVDLVASNNTGRDIDIKANIDGFDESFNHYGIVAYDDEGNMYNYKQIGVSMANQPNYNSVILPTENMVKVRVQIKGIDEFATEITTFISPIYIPERNHTYWGVLRVTNIPIPRE